MMFGTVSQWTEEREALLRELAPQGSNTWVAKVINERTGSNFTRNAIIGKRARSGILSVAKHGGRRGNQVPRKPYRRRSVGFQFRHSGPRLAPDQSVFEDAPEAEFLSIALLDLEHHQCRYARGGEGDKPYFFCGQPTKTDSSYCPFHHGIVWVKPTRNRKPEREAA